MPLRIGVNALFMIPGGVGGTEVYLRNLLSAIAENPRGHEYVVFVNQETGDTLTPAESCFRTVNTGVAATSRPGRILFEQTLLPRAVHAEKIDILYNPGFTSPSLVRCPGVTLIHDLQHHRHPEYFKPADLLAWRFFVWLSAKTSRRILAVSDASRDDIHCVYGVPLDRIATAEPGVEPELFHLIPSGEEPLILCVSTLHPHKNLERLVDAFSAFHTRRPEYRLVLAGMRGFHADAIERRIRHHALESAVSITGWLPRPAILALYARARIAVFPSTFEGFGMPVLEAMAAGVPLIASAIPPIVETTAGTALLFSPGDTDALAGALEQFAADPAVRAGYAARARVRAAAYTWSRTAGITLDTLEQAARS